MNLPSLHEWMTELITTTDEVAAEAFGFESLHLVDRGSWLPAGLTGSYISLVGDEVALELGVAASSADCDTLTRAMLCMEAEEVVDEFDQVDTMGEIANLLAGGVKTQMGDRIPPLQLGLPIVICGHMARGSLTELQTATVEWGGIQATLLLVEKKGDGCDD